jgi:hypothetical protein
MSTVTDPTRGTVVEAVRTAPAAFPRRAVAAAGLLGIALIHVLDLPGKLRETPYLGAAYLGLIATSLCLAELMLRRDDRRLWVATAGLAAAVALGYVVSRTVGLPGAMDDIGNWLEPLGLASLFVEGTVVLVALPGAAGHP